MSSSKDALRSYLEALEKSTQLQYSKWRLTSSSGSSGRLRKTQIETSNLFMTNQACYTVAVSVCIYMCFKWHEKPANDAKKHCQTFF